MSRVSPDSLTPRRIVEELDRHIIGQNQAKRAIAIAMRNRWRRQNVPAPLADDISPKNIIMVGPTGVGKTELARRLAKLCGAPFLKVEVSKFTEVGYVGRDVDSIVRDLAEIAAGLVRADLRHEVAAEAKKRAEERILELLLPAGNRPAAGASGVVANSEPASATRERLRELLRAGKLDDREVEIEVEQASNLSLQVVPGLGATEQIGQQLRDMLGGLGRRRHRRTVKVEEARRVLADDEASRLVDEERVAKEAVRRAEDLGVVFLDEIDKVCGREGARGSDISREGVQRDLLPIVEGSSVATKYGQVRTDHVLFIAAGAFHLAKVSDLIPELQGRFPIRVELESLGASEFVRILREPHHSLLTQYEAMLATEGMKLIFDDDAVVALAEAAATANASLENIGARRLHTVLERVLEEVSFEASELGSQEIRVTGAYVQARLAGLLRDQDLSRHIL